jgi:hypothetical protein
MLIELAPILAVTRSLDDPLLAQLLRAQCERLRDESPSTREQERAAKRAWLAAAPSRALRRHLSFGRLFGQHVTAFDDDDGRYVWAYDSDLMSLDEGKVDPWVDNVEMEQEMRALWSNRGGTWVRSLRLILFEGIARAAALVAKLRAAERVTHVDLRCQSREPLGPVVRAFPALVGLRCKASDLPALLAEEAPTLCALSITMARWDTRVLELVLRAPAVRHLELGFSLESTHLFELMRHPMMGRLTSLGLSTPSPGSLLDHLDELRPLRRIELSARRLTDRTRARLQAALPQANIDADEVDRMALDFATVGWCSGTR